MLKNYNTRSYPSSKKYIKHRLIKKTTAWFIYVQMLKIIYGHYVALVFINIVKKRI